MKKLRFKILMATIVAVMLLTCVFVINAFAEGSTSRVTFVQNGASTYSKIVAEGDSITLPTPEARIGGTVYGWFDRDGNFYECGESITPTKSVTLYCAEGAEIALSGSLPLSISKGFNYIKLNSNISLTSKIELPDGIYYIDLNGNNFFFETEADGFVGENFGLILANSSSEKSTLTHIAGGEEAFSLNSLISISPNTTISNLSFVIKDGVSVKENMNLISVQKDISSYAGALSIQLYGELESGKIIRSTGISGATFTVYDGAKLTTDCEYYFDDVVEESSGVAATLIIYGGEFYVNNTTSYASDTTKFRALVYGGSFSKNTTDFFFQGNYKSSYNATTTLYDFTKCEHHGSLIEHAPDCTSNITLNHFCKYCDTVYEKNYPNGVGHSYTPKLTEEIINTPEETKAGCYTLTCTKCGHQTKEYTYPDPATVWVTVGFIDFKGDVQYVRFPSTDLYSFDGTKVVSFSADALWYDYKNSDGEVDSLYIQQSNVFHVEIPLGATDIYGDSKVQYGEETPYGVFVRNDHLKSVSFPVSLKNIDKFAFSYMTNLETLIGIENVTGTIGERAFEQTSDSKLVMTNLTLNAKTIKKGAFKNVRMTILTLGASVGSIEQNAFALDSGITSLLKEIFIEDNRLGEGKTVQEVYANLRKGMSNGHQFDGQEIVFFGHDYVSVTVESTCETYGYDLLTCSRCGFNEKSNFSDTLAEHKYIPHNKPATCQALGYEGEICTVCNHIHVINDLYYDRNNHSYTHKEVPYPAEKGFSICVDPYYTLGQCICGAVEKDIPENRSEIYLPAEGADHVWKETIETANTCGDWGLSRYDCSVCGLSRTASTKPTEDHTWEFSVTVPATCKEGEKGLATCSVCGQEKNTTSPTVDPNGHVIKDGDPGEVVQEPTEVHTGSRRYFCALCGKEFFRDIPTLEPTDDELSPMMIVGIVIGVAFGILLVAGLVLTFVFTFTKRRSKARGYRFGFNTIKNGGEGTSKSVAEQLAAMNLSEELPPEVEIGENGLVDEEAAFTAYMDAISGFDATRELNIAEEEPTEAEAVNPDLAWQAYVDAINKEYEETMEISLHEEQNQKSFAEMMDETVIDLGIGELNQEFNEDDVQMKPLDEEEK